MDRVDLVISGWWWPCLGDGRNQQLLTVWWVPGQNDPPDKCSPRQMFPWTNVPPDKNARTCVARTYVPRTTGAASNDITVPVCYGGWEHNNFQNIRKCFIQICSPIWLGWAGENREQRWGRDNITDSELISIFKHSKYIKKIGLCDGWVRRRSCLFPCMPNTPKQ